MKENKRAREERREGGKEGWKKGRREKETSAGTWHSGAYTVCLKTPGGAIHIDSRTDGISWNCALLRL